MPGVERVSLDRLSADRGGVCAAAVPGDRAFPGHRAVAQVARRPRERRTQTASCRVYAQQLKQRFPELGVLTDVALDPYTTHGQDGVIDSAGYVLNDETIAILTKQASCGAGRR